MVWTQAIFNVVMSQCMTGSQKQIQHLLATSGMSEAKILQKFSGNSHNQSGRLTSLLNGFELQFNQVGVDAVFLGS